MCERTRAVDSGGTVNDPDNTQEERAGTANTQKVSEYRMCLMLDNEFRCVNLGRIAMQMQCQADTVQETGRSARLRNERTSYIELAGFQACAVRSTGYDDLYSELGSRPTYFARGRINRSIRYCSIA